VSAEALVVEILDGHGRVQARERLRMDADGLSFTVGRSTAADVVLDDPYVAPLHVAIEASADGRVRATDLGSVNGLVVGAQRYRNAHGLDLPGGLVQVGRTRLRVRVPGEKLPPERPDHAAGDAFTARVAVSGVLACALCIGYYSWLAAPWDPVTVFAINMIKVLPAAGAWIAVWSLISRVITGEWRWVTHAAILFVVSGAALLLDLAVDVAWFSLALPQWPWRNALIPIATVAVALHWHLTQGSHMRGRTAVLVALVLPVVAVGGTTWGNLREQDRNVNFIGGQLALYPPALRVRGGGTLEDYFAAAARLRQTADARRRDVPGDDGDEASGGN
jgi:hypothetical protein